MNTTVLLTKIFIVQQRYIAQKRTIAIRICYYIALLLVSGQLPSRKTAPWTVPPGLLPPRMIASGLLLLGNYPKDNCPLTIYPWKLPPTKIAFRMICRLHNCPSDKWPQGKLPSRKIVPRINYTRDIFSPRIRNWQYLLPLVFLICGLKYY